MENLAWKTLRWPCVVALRLVVASCPYFFLHCLASCLSLSVIMSFAFLLSLLCLVFFFFLTTLFSILECIWRAWIVASECWPSSNRSRTAWRSVSIFPSHFLLSSYPLCLHLGTRLPQQKAVGLGFTSQWGDSTLGLQVSVCPSRRNGSGSMPLPCICSCLCVCVFFCICVCLGSASVWCVSV